MAQTDLLIPFLALLVLIPTIHFVKSYVRHGFKVVRRHLTSVPSIDEDALRMGQKNHVTER